MGVPDGDADQLQKAIWFLENELEARDPASGQSLGYQYDPTDMNIGKYVYPDWRDRMDWRKSVEYGPDKW